MAGLILFRCPECGGLTLIDSEQFEGRKPIRHNEPSCSFSETVNVQEEGRLGQGAYELAPRAWQGSQLREVEAYALPWSNSGAVHGNCPACGGPVLLRRRARGDGYQVLGETAIECPACRVSSPYGLYLQRPGG